MYKPILYFEDPVGVTSTYLKLFTRISDNLAKPVSLYRIHDKRDLLMWRGNRKQPGYRLEAQNVRKVQDSVIKLIRQYEPKLVVTSDPATLGLLVTYREESWDWATVENLRGGVYRFWGIPWIVTYPMTAFFKEVRERDIAVANDGFSDQEQFADHKRDAGDYERADADADADESGDADYATDTTETDATEAAGGIAESAEAASADADTDSDHFYTPILTRVSVGKFCLTSDWHKAFRVLESEQRRIEDGAATGNKRRENQPDL